MGTASVPDQRQQLEVQGIEQITISVNVSSKQLSAGNFAEKVRQLVALTEFQPQRLELEITESAVMENPNQVIVELNQIRDLGVNISLDDFGTGYSSLSYLKKLPVTKSKSTALSSVTSTSTKMMKKSSRPSSP